jgi:hypothetical protein
MARKPHNDGMVDEGQRSRPARSRARNTLKLRLVLSELSDAAFESTLIDLLDAAEQYHCTSTLDARHRAPDLNQGNRL